MSAQNCLCVFARTPQLGQVKQRLAAALGDAGALAAHEELLRGLLDRTVGGGDYQVQVWLTTLAQSLPGWLQPGAFTLHEQHPGDLGARMQSCMETALESYGRCVLVGSDCPEIDAAYVESAFQALHDHDVVFGPAEDGGYGLIGLSRPVPEIFAESHWGDAGVLLRARDRAEAARATVKLLPVIYDVDELDDWQRYRAALGPHR